MAMRMMTPTRWPRRPLWESAQSHNFDSLSDEDWLEFTAFSGTPYVIRTAALGPSADTYVYLYDTDGPLSWQPMMTTVGPWRPRSSGLRDHRYVLCVSSALEPERGWVRNLLRL